MVGRAPRLRCKRGKFQGAKLPNSARDRLSHAGRREIWRPHRDVQEMNSMPRGNLLSNPLCQVAMAVLIVLGVSAPSCGGGGGGGSSDQISATSPPPPPPPTPSPPPPSTPAPAPALNLTESDVNTVVLQAVNQASALGAPATIAVVDRVGNVLAVTQMMGAPAMATVTSRTGVATTSIPPPPENGLEGVPVPNTLAAISKAITGAYLSSNGTPSRPAPPTRSSSSISTRASP